MPEPREQTEKRKPFQYSLRSLFVVTTLLAVWLGLWKLSPLLGVAFFAVPFFSLPSLLFYFRGRWLMRNGWPRAGIACLANGLVVAIIPILVSGLVQVPGLERITGNPNWIFFTFLILPIPMLLIWELVPLLTDPNPYEERKQADATRKASERTNAPRKDQR